MKIRILQLAVLFSFLQSTYAQPGRPDSSFGNDGIVRTDFGGSAKVDVFGRQMLTASDGTNYLILSTNGGQVIARLLDNGTIDTSYGNNGYSQLALINGYVTGLFGNDGKIILAGTRNADFAVARYNKDGTLDTTFSGDGQNAIIIETEAIYAFAAAIERDGTVVLAGALGRQPDDYFFGVARFNANGSPDTTLGKDGKVIRGMGQGINYSNGMAIQTDGKIVVASETYDDGPAVIQRFNRDGSYDNGFSEDGIQSINFYPGFVVIQNDGKIVLGPSQFENRTSNFPLARYNADGTPDSTFSEDGKQTIDFLAVYIVIQSDGKFVLAGSSSNNFTVERYNTDGTIDSTFGENGKQTTDFEVAYEYVYSATIQDNGKITAVGYTSLNGSNYSYALARYNTDGSPDNTFSEDGKLSDYIHGGTTYFAAAAAQSDGKILAVGRADTGGGEHFALARYNTDGTLDTAFSNDGKQTTDFGLARDFANAVKVQGNGKIVVAGFAYNTTDSIYFALARYNPDGSPDTTFSRDGKKIAHTIPNPRGVKISGYGKILVVGGYNYFTIARYTANGDLDSTFSDDGIQKTTYTANAYAASVQSDGKILVAGQSYYRHFLISRFNTDGSVDSTFSGDGLQATDFNSLEDYASLVAIQSDGKIIAAGAAGTTAGLDFGIARYNTDGSADSTFSEDGKQTLNFSSADNNVSSIAIQEDGKIVIGGTANNNFAIARLNKNGSLDSSFGTQGKQLTQVTEGIGNITGITVSGNGLYASGNGQSLQPVGVIVKYQLDSDSSSTPPTVSITTPADNAVYTVGTYIKVNATAADADGTITKVEFYSNSTLLHTQTVIPYGYQLKHLPLGNYTITAKAYDNSGNVTTSAPVHISVVPNKAPVVGIISPANNSIYSDTSTIHFEAAAGDSDGRITRVEFYKDSTLLRTEYKYPYTCNWKNAAAGTYTITAKATDNRGAQTTSAPVTITVTSGSSIVSNRLYSQTEKTASKDALSLRLSPNPAGNVINIQTNGLQANKPATLSIISISGNVLKTINISKALTQLDVSSLAGGVYTIKIISEEKVSYKQFVKL